MFNAQIQMKQWKMEAERSKGNSGAWGRIGA